MPPRRDLHALLIGIDAYPALEASPAGTSAVDTYCSLQGSVRDVERMRAFLQNDLRVPSRRIHMLRAPDPPCAASQDLPTYEAMVAGWQHLCAAARSGDQVLVHFSGHGGRVPALAPQIKANGLDETLVPTNVAEPSARHLRDLEIAELLREMVDKGLFVTLVLDCCHAGGITRTGPTPRGGARVDTTARPTASRVATKAALAENWRRTASATSRDALVHSGWLPNPRGYVLLAACRAHELAYEQWFPGVGKAGALTHWLLEALRVMSSETSYRQLHQRVAAQVRSQLEVQTPQIEGDTDRLLFADRLINPPLDAVSVLRIAGDRVLLNTGEAQGVRAGARFVVDTSDAPAGDAGAGLAELSVTEVGAVDSWALVLPSSRRAAIRAGAVAWPCAQPAAHRRRRIRLIDRSSTDESPSVAATWREAIDLTIDRHGHEWLCWAGNGESADFEISIRDQEWTITGPSGGPPAHLPSPPDDSPQVAARWLLDRLVHLARYFDLRALRNPDAESPLAGKLHVALQRLPRDYDPGDSPRPLRQADPLPRLDVTVGDWLCLRIENRARQPFDVTVLDLQPAWSIAQLFPSRSGGTLNTLDPGQDLLIPLRAELPAAVDAGVDVLKVFATLEATDFRWLELAPMTDRPPGQIHPKPRQATTGGLRRCLEPSAYPSRDWAVEQVEVAIARDAD